MTSRFVLTGSLIVSHLVVAFWVLPGAATAAALVHHRAIYAIGLDRAEAGAGVVGVEGAMIYKFADGCDGWTVENQTYMRFDYEEERSLDSSWSYASWESKDGLSYRFRVSQTRNGEPGEAYQGTATVPRGGGAGRAQFTEPAPVEVVLPPGTMFPTRHLFAIVEAGQAGALNFNRIMFDGTSLDNPCEVNAVITPLPAAVLGEATKGAGLGARPGWNMSLAFYPWQAPTGLLPEVQLHIQYRDDGIAEELMQDYGDITLKLRLSEVEPLPRPEC